MPTTSKTYRIATPSGKLFIHSVRSGRLRGERNGVALMSEREATTWKSRKRAEEVLQQARAQYPLSDLEIVVVGA